MLNKKVFFTIVCLFVGNMLYANNTSTLLREYLHSHHESHIRLLFLQEAEQATLTPKSNGCYNLSLTKLQPGLLYFSDRPNTVSGYMNVREFMSIWGKSNVIHNSVLHGYAKANDHTSTSIALSISLPSYHSKWDRLSYKACLMDVKSEKAWPATTLHNITLFVDPFSYGYG